MADCVLVRQVLSRSDGSEWLCRVPTQKHTDDFKGNLTLSDPGIRKFTVRRQRIKIPFQNLPSTSVASTHYPLQVLV